MKRLEAALNEELVKVLGARHNWMGVIAGVAVSRASEFARTKNGLLEDVIADVTGDIILAAKEGSFAGAVIRAKEASHTDAELVDNLRPVVIKAAFYRVSDAMRFRYRSGTQFSQIGGTDGFAETVEARPDTDSDSDLSEYTELLMNELEVMATTADWQYAKVGNPSHFELAKRLRKSKEMVSDRVNGMVFKDLKAKYGGSNQRMQDHIDDIRKSLSRVAKRLGDTTLIAGVARGSKWGSKVVS
jgi:hypothetical protein